MFPPRRALLQKPSYIFCYFFLTERKITTTTTKWIGRAFIYPPCLSKKNSLSLFFLILSLLSSHSPSLTPTTILSIRFGQLPGMVGKFNRGSHHSSRHLLCFLNENIPLLFLVFIPLPPLQLLLYYFSTTSIVRILLSLPCFFFQFIFYIQQDNE